MSYSGHQEDQAVAAGGVAPEDEGPDIGGSQPQEASYTHCQSPKHCHSRPRPRAQSQCQGQAWSPRSYPGLAYPCSSASLCPPIPRSSSPLQESSRSWGASTLPPGLWNGEAHGGHCRRATAFREENRRCFSLRIVTVSASVAAAEKPAGTGCDWTGGPPAGHLKAGGSRVEGPGC